MFHRVINGFMIQGGGFTKDLDAEAHASRDPERSEQRLLNLKGTVAMARTNDPAFGDSQFFINVVDNKRLRLRQ